MEPQSREGDRRADRCDFDYNSVWLEQSKRIRPTSETSFHSSYPRRGEPVVPASTIEFVSGNTSEGNEEEPPMVIVDAAGENRGLLR